MSLKLITLTLFVGTVATLGACSSNPQTTNHRSPATGSAGSVGGGGTTAGTGSAVGGSSGASTGSSGEAGGAAVVAGTGGGGGTSAGGGSGVNICKAAGAEVALPLTVDSSFIASGYFAGPEFPDDADDNPNVTGIVEVACDDRPENPHGHVGNCHRWEFQAVKLAGEPAGAWGGVFWQAPADNWGTSPGIKAAAGATKVKFRAWGEVGGEVVSFSAGGITSATCNDDVQLGMAGETEVTLTTTPTDYEVDLQGQTYPNGIIGGFSWSAATEDTTTKTIFYIDDLQWVDE